MAIGSAFVVLVHEWVTGGGLAGMPLPASWVREGGAMRRAIGVRSCRIVIQERDHSR